ncbi:MAG: L-aspartate oxidase [Ignavibacteriaceae bacterium]|nr:MAG: aspartate oxidase [Chlorobi bacterium OLB4]MBV6399098.1 L-aspartate oxidase [Ignavibacteria bacterium]MCC6885316.1 L-aspartate oxidase [Ignavibacteriales bacterium]MEB2330176.1 L-aspartate oxidase [Ignavibacteriaceae bacterium]
MTTDFLIIGSGIAGLTLGLKLSKLGKVTIITKKRKADSNTNWAQGGIASVISEDDSFDLHIRDTLECGVGLCNKEAVRKIVTEGPAMINELLSLGANFSHKDGKIELGKEGGHSVSRIVHADDLTGREIENTLLEAVNNSPNIELLEYFFAIDLLISKNIKSKSRKKFSSDECFGVYALDVTSGNVEKIIASYTILASGGVGQVYMHTTNPGIATGDGIAMGYRAGCEIANMEFIQFHPTSFYEPDSEDKESVYLITEAARGAGAILKTAEGKEFMKDYDPRGELAPRDIVARAIDDQLKKSGNKFVYLDMSTIDDEKIKSEFPNIYKTCLQKGLDVTREPIPVVPAAHYVCGGIKTDLKGRTNLKNLFACGEVTMTGVHGANRLASNSLLEGMVFANAIYKFIYSVYTERKPVNASKLYDAVYNWDDSGTENAEEWILISHDKREIKELMSDYVGIVRSTYRLERAMRRIKMLKAEINEFYYRTKVSVELLELRNIVTTAYLIIKSSLKRKESRGLHYVTDFPVPKDEFLTDTILKKKNP